MPSPVRIDISIDTLPVDGFLYTPESPNLLIVSISINSKRALTAVFSSGARFVIAFKVEIEWPFISVTPCLLSVSKISVLPKILFGSACSDIIVTLPVTVRCIILLDTTSESDSIFVPSGSSIEYADVLAPEPSVFPLINLLTVLSGFSPPTALESASLK